MFRILLTKYWVLAHLLVIAGTLCFAPAYTVGMGLWAVASLLLMALCLPPVLRGESFWLARTRAAHALRHDIVTWSGLLAALYVGMGLLNGPRTLEYASELRRWLWSSPKLPFLPSSVEPAEGVPFFVGLVCGLACAAVIRAVMPRGQRLFALIGLGVLTGALTAVGGVFCAVTGEVPDFAWLGGRFGVSALWLLMFCVCLGIVGEEFLEARMRTCVWALAGAVLNEVGLFAFGAPAFVGAATVVAVMWLAFAAFATRAAGRGRQLLWNSVLMLPFLFGAGVGVALVPGAALAHAGFSMEALAASWQTFQAQWPFRAGLALEVFGANPMLGAGPEGFAHNARFYVSGSLGWSLWKSGGVGVPCDLLRLLVERGMVGALLLLLPGFALIGRCLMRAMEFSQDLRHRYSLRYVFVLAGSVLGVVATLVASFFGTPLHAPAVLCAFLIVCACMGGWMPRPR